MRILSKRNSVIQNENIIEEKLNELRIQRDALDKAISNLIGLKEQIRASYGLNEDILLL